MQVCPTLLVHYLLSCVVDPKWFFSDLAYGFDENFGCGIRSGVLSKCMLIANFTLFSLQIALYPLLKMKNISNYLNLQTFNLKLDPEFISDPVGPGSGSAYCHYINFKNCNHRAWGWQMFWTSSLSRGLWLNQVLLCPNDVFFLMIARIHILGVFYGT